jgi:hypothetical protein
VQFFKWPVSGSEMQGLYFVTASSMAVLLCRKHVSAGTSHDSCSAQNSITAIPCNNNKNNNNYYNDEDGSDNTVGSGKFSRQC